MSEVSVQKEIAIACLEKLDIYKPYIRKFKSKAGIPCFFENFAGFYVDQELEIWKKVKEVEVEYNCVVYALTHEFINDDEMWSMLCVTQNTEMDDLIMDADNDCYYVFSYVWNKTNEQLSELGDIFVRSFGGGIRREY